MRCAGRWRSRRVEYENATLTVRLALVRTSGYYIYNLIVPLLVLVSIQLGTIFVPANTQDKPTLILGVVVPFFFYQVKCIHLLTCIRSFVPYST